MPALRRTLVGMGNHWQMERLVREYQRDALTAPHGPAVLPQRGARMVRVRLGQALVALGVRLARESGRPGSRGQLEREDLLRLDPRADRVLRMQPRFERGSLLRQVEVEHRLL
jgi:hypothetical protein